MATPECLVKLKKKAFDKGFLLEQIPYGVRLTDYNGVPVVSYGAGFWALTYYHTEAHDFDAGELAGEIRAAIEKDRRNSESQRKLALAREERRSRGRKQREAC